MSISDVNQNKVLNAKDLLLEIIKKPVEFKEDNDLIKALKSQGGLAKYENLEKSIAACSLNTLKSASETLLNRGFLELDELRVNARNALEGALVESKANSRTRTGLKYKVSDLQSQCDSLQKSNFLLSSIVDELRGELKIQAFESNDARLIKRYREMNKRLEAKLSYTLHSDL